MLASARRQAWRRTAASASPPVPDRNVGRAFTPAAKALRYRRVFGTIQASFRRQSWRRAAASASPPVPGRPAIPGKRHRPDKPFSDGNEKETRMIKLIATDLDGTLLDPKSRLDPGRFWRVFDRIKAAGCHFVLASGDQYYCMRNYFGPRGGGTELCSRKRRLGPGRGRPARCSAPPSRKRFGSRWPARCGITGPIPRRRCWSAAKSRLTCPPTCRPTWQPSWRIFIPAPPWRRIWTPSTTRSSNSALLGAGGGGPTGGSTACAAACPPA